MRFIYLGLLLIVFSCSTPDREKSNELNGIGTDYFFKATSRMGYSDSASQARFADSCLYFMSESIRADSSNKSAYWNKLAFEHGLRRFEQAKATALLCYKRFDDPLALMKLGQIYLQLNDSVKSKEYYRQALDFYEDGIKSGKFIEDSILIDLAMVNLANNRIDESNGYLERHRATGQMSLEGLEFDTARQLIVGDSGNAR